MFFVILVVLILATLRKDPNSHEMRQTHTQELKGVAILMVIFGHVGYFLAKDSRFLYPLSVAAGVGLNIFLFLSGYGITSSALKAKLSIRAFYTKRLLGLYVPLWLMLTCVLILFFVLLRVTFPIGTIIRSYVGFFPRADIFIDINSPLWYFTFIVFYYLLFPLVFFKRYPLVSALLVLGISLFIVNLKLPVTVDLQRLYKLHTLAFPLGMMAAPLVNYNNIIKLKTKFQTLTEVTKKLIYLLRYVILCLLVYIVCYTAINSGVGESVAREQLVSLVTAGGIILLMLFKRIQSKILIIIGIYSYEIYLIHWPLMYRFDVLYKFLPAGIATAVYIVILIFLGMLFHKICEVLIKKFNPIRS